MNLEKYFSSPAFMNDTNLMQNSQGDVSANTGDGAHKILFYLTYGEYFNEGKICLFNSSTIEFATIEKFSTWARPNGVATGDDKIFLLDGYNEVFEIFNYKTKQFEKDVEKPIKLDKPTRGVQEFLRGMQEVPRGMPEVPRRMQKVSMKIPGSLDIKKLYQSAGNIAAHRSISGLPRISMDTPYTPLVDYPEWRGGATVAYYNNKLYYIGGYGSNNSCSRYVHILPLLENGKWGEWKQGPIFPKDICLASHVICNNKLYIISANDIFKLFDNEREWTKGEHMKKRRQHPGVASLDGKIYITGGYDGNILNSCLCFDPGPDLDSSQPSDKRFTSIANMHFKRYCHSLVAAKGKLYAIGGYQAYGPSKFCRTIEEYDPKTDSWRIT